MLNVCLQVKAVTCRAMVIAGSIVSGYTELRRGLIQSSRVAARAARSERVSA